MINNKDTTNLDYLLSHYKNAVDFRKNNIQSSVIIKHIESFFGNSISCGSCPSALKKAISDYERLIFTKLYREYPTHIYTLDKDLFAKTRFRNGMYESLITSSFDSFPPLLESFVRDHNNNRQLLGQELFTSIYDELIAFNTNRFRYFESDLYLDYLASKELSIESDTIVSETNNPVENGQGESLKEKLDISTAVIVVNTNKQGPKSVVDLVEALELKKSGMSNEEIGNRYGVTKQAIGKLFKKHLINDVTN